MTQSAKQSMSRSQAYQLFPALPQALRSLDPAIFESGLDKRLLHLVDARASQINRCGFCLHMHHAEARHDGEDQQRLDVLPAWREVPWFDAREQAALAWCEALTDLNQGHPSDELCKQVQEQFTEPEFLALTAAIIKINAWNRLVAATHMTPERKTAS